MESNLKGVFAPIFGMMGTFLGSLSNLATMANSIRVEFATFMGGINTVLQNFVDRFTQLMTNIRVAAMRMKMLFGRLYGLFFAVIYISSSATLAFQNFGRTFLFRFIDTFCFAPETLVDVDGKGSIMMKDVMIGDIFSKTGSRVTSTFQFWSDGQPMVVFPGDIQISTNHYVTHKGKHVRSDEHPDATPIGDWSGGIERPLICFNTSDHKIPVGDYVFLDYDETGVADHATMAWVESKVNGKKQPQKKQYHYDYTTVFSPNLRVRVLDDMAATEAHHVPLGARISTGEVIGIVKKEINAICILPTGECVTPGSLLWNSKKEEWSRAGEMYPIRLLKEPTTYMNFIVNGTSTIEFASGRFMRDYVEIHSPDSEQFYAAVIEASS